MMMPLPAGVQHKILTRQSLWDLWETVRQFDRLFSDEVRGDPIAFWQNILKDAVILETDDGGGILTLSGIKPGLRAEAHITFWDRKISCRVELIRECLLWAFMNFDLYRIEVFTPAIGHSLGRILKKIGFKDEGTLRNRSWYKGQLIDTHVFGMLREEVLNG